MFCNAFKWPCDWEIVVIYSVLYCVRRPSVVSWSQIWYRVSQVTNCGFPVPCSRLAKRNLEKVWNGLSYSPFLSQYPVTHPVLSHSGKKQIGSTSTGFLARREVFTILRCFYVWYLEWESFFLLGLPKGRNSNHVCLEVFRFVCLHGFQNQCLHWRRGPETSSGFASCSWWC